MQPIWYEGLGIVFNGEIYNYKSLRRNLKSSDILLKLIQIRMFFKAISSLWIQSFSMINGMFGVCIIDLKKKKSLSVETESAKPLYYYKKKVYLYSVVKLKQLLVF